MTLAEINTIMGVASFFVLIGLALALAYLMRNPPKGRETERPKPSPPPLKPKYCFPPVRQIPAERYVDGDYLEGGDDNGC